MVTEKERTFYDLARAAGKAGRSWGEWSMSDDAQALITTVEYLDSDAVEVAFAKGRRETLAATWRTVWTTAPAAYDGGGTDVVETCGEFHGKDLRRVLIDPHDYTWQTDRYASGLHGSWDEDPRVEETRVRDTAEKERVRRVEDAARREVGLVWLATAPLSEIEDTDENYDLWHAKGLRSDDARAERVRRQDAESAAKKAAEWARCIALVPDGATLIDDGCPSKPGSFGYRIPGRDPGVWQVIRVEAGWPANDPDKATVVETDGEKIGDRAYRSREVVGSLTYVAQWVTEGRIRVATPEEQEAIPPPAVLKRLGHREWKRVRRVVVEDRTVWVARPVFGLDPIVLDDAGHLVRAKKVREAALLAR